MPAKPAWSGKIWTYQGLDRTLSTVSVADGLVYISDVGGRLHCLDDATGQCYWIHDTDCETWGSTLVADGKVYMPTTKGLWVLATGKERKVLGRVTLGGKVYASPVVANGTLYVATTPGLALGGLPAGSVSENRSETWFTDKMQSGWWAGPFDALTLKAGRHSLSVCARTDPRAKRATTVRRVSVQRTLAPSARFRSAGGFPEVTDVSRLSFCASQGCAEAHVEPTLRDGRHCLIAIS